MKGKSVILIILVGLVIGLTLYSFADEINIFNVRPFSKILFWIIWSSVIFLISFLWDLFLKKYSIITAILFFLGIMAGVIINIVLDINFNSTSHSLWGLEVIVMSFITAPLALLGVGLSQLIIFLIRKRKQNTNN